MRTYRYFLDAFKTSCACCTASTFSRRACFSHARRLALAPHLQHMQNAQRRDRRRAARERSERSAECNQREAACDDALLEPKPTLVISCAVLVLEAGSAREREQLVELLRAQLAPVFQAASSYARASDSGLARTHLMQFTGLFSVCILHIALTVA